MVSVTSLPGADIDARKSTRSATVSWVLVAVYYFYQYVLRSAPSVMMPQLTEAFGLSALGRRRSLFSAERNRAWGSTQSCKAMR